MQYEEITQNIGSNTDKSPLIRGINTESRQEGKGKVIYDLGFMATDATNQQHYVFIDVQTYADKGRYTGSRIVYYGGRKISGQKNIDFIRNHYDDMKPILDIWIIMERKTAITVKSGEGILIAEDENMTREEILREIDCADLFRTHNLIVLGIPEELPQKSEDFYIHRFLYLLLNVSLPMEVRAKMLYEEYGYLSEEEYTEELTGIMQYGISIGEKAWDEGHAEGLAQGRREGRAEGRREAWKEAEQAAKERETAAKENAERHLAKSMRDDGDSIEHIAHIFHTSEEDVRKLLNE